MTPSDDDLPDRRDPADAIIRWVRWTAGGFGAAGLISAGVLAFMTANPLVLLFISVVLVVLAMIGPNWQKLTVKIGDNEIAAERFANDKANSSLAGIKETVESRQDIPPDVAQELTALANAGQRAIDAVRGISSIVVFPNGGTAIDRDHTMIRTYPSPLAQTYTDHVLLVVTPDGRFFRQFPEPDGYGATLWPEEFKEVHMSKPPPADEQWLFQPDPGGAYFVNWFARPPEGSHSRERVLIARHRFNVGPDTHQTITDSLDPAF